MAEFLTNFLKPPVVVCWFQLLRTSRSPKNLKSRCPTCKIGILPMERDAATGELAPHDYCIRCGQRVIYADIERVKFNMRQRV